MGEYSEDFDYKEYSDFINEQSSELNHKPKRNSDGA